MSLNKLSVATSYSEIVGLLSTHILFTYVYLTYVTYVQLPETN